MPLITLNANFNVERKQKKVEKEIKKQTKNAILSFIGFKAVQTNPLAYLLLLRLFLGYFWSLSALILLMFGMVFIEERGCC